MRMRVRGVSMNGCLSIKGSSSVVERPGQLATCGTAQNAIGPATVHFFSFRGINCSRTFADRFSGKENAIGDVRLFPLIALNQLTFDLESRGHKSRSRIMVTVTNDGNVVGLTSILDRGQFISSSRVYPVRQSRPNYVKSGQAAPDI